MPNGTRRAKRAVTAGRQSPSHVRSSGHLERSFVQSHGKLIDSYIS